MVEERMNKLEKMMFEIMNVQKENSHSALKVTESTAVMVATLNSHALLINGINNSLSVIQDDTKALQSEVETLKFNTEIETKQADKIRITANKRVASILSHNNYEIQKYFRRFITRLYRDAKTYSDLGSKIEMTKKGNFQRVIDYIEAWIPSEGCAKLKEKCDEKAKAKALAKINGYEV